MLAFVFPGQGSQRVGMGSDLAKRYPTAMRTFQEADEALGFSLSKLCFEGPEDQLTLTANSQPAILAVSTATLRVLQEETNLWPHLVAGHSVGEFSALVCARALEFRDAVRIVNKRGQFMQEAVPAGKGGMAAIMGVEPAQVEAMCKEAAEGDLLAPANYNGPGQVVVSGSSTAIARIVRLAESKGATARELQVSAPFHSSMMEPAAAKLAAEFAAVRWSTPLTAAVSNVDAEPHRDAGELSSLLLKQVSAPVRWDACVRKMVQLGVEQFVEIGWGTTLSGLIKRIDGSVAVTNIQAAEHIEAAKASASGAWKANVPERGWALRDDGAAITLDAMRIRWRDGMEWSFVDPAAHGF